jgi:hypothetical protein
MKIGVVTTLNKKLYKEYGHKFFETYNWPFDLIVYSEDMMDIPNMKGLVVRSSYEEIPELKEFVERNKDRPVADTPQGYLHDAVRFSYKVYAYCNEIITSEDYDGLICIDADSIFNKRIDEDWIEKHIHRQESFMTYLGRGDLYSECGFLYFNLKHENCWEYAVKMKEIYNSDTVYKLKESHDSYVWDYVRKQVEEIHGCKNYSIGDGKPGHVQARSILGPVYDHIKGPKRKKLMRSPERKF